MKNSKGVTNNNNNCVNNNYRGHSLSRFDHRVKVKESEKKNKYLDLATESKLWNMKVTGQNTEKRFAVTQTPVENHQLTLVLKEREKKDKYLDLSRELKKKRDGDTNCNWSSWYSHRRIIKGTGRHRNKRTSRDHPNYCIIKIGWNTEKSPGDLKILAVPQIPVKKHRLMLLWKTRKGVTIIPL